MSMHNKRVHKTSFSTPQGHNFPCLQSIHRWSVYNFINSKNIKLFSISHALLLIHRVRAVFNLFNTRIDKKALVNLKKGVLHSQEQHEFISLLQNIPSTYLYSSQMQPQNNNTDNHLARTIPTSKTR